MKNGKRWGVLGLCAIAAFAGFFLYRWSVMPVVVTPSQRVGNVQASQDAVVVLQEDLFETTIPSAYQKKPADPANYPLLGQYVVRHEQQTIGDQLAITIGVAETQRIDEISGVRLRRLRSEAYSEVATSDAFPPGSLVFESKNGTFETAVFWIHDGRYVSVVVTGTVDRKAVLDRVTTQAVTNWRWR